MIKEGREERSRRSVSRSSTQSSRSKAKDEERGTEKVKVEEQEVKDQVKVEVEEGKIKSENEEAGLVKEEEEVEKTVKVEEMGEVVKQEETGGDEDGNQELSDISDAEFEIDDENMGEEEELVQEKPANVMDVDWQSLMNDYNPPPKPEPTAASDIMKKFTPGNILARIGVSRTLAGPELMKQVEEVCAKAAEEEGSEEKPLFLSDIGAFNAERQRKIKQRRNLFDLGPCCRALSARKDLAIRRKLRKSDKVSDQICSLPVVDADLYRMGIQLFKHGKLLPEEEVTPPKPTSQEVVPVVSVAS